MLRRDPLLAVGLAFLASLLFLAAFGPTLRDRQLQLGDTRVSAVLDPVSQPYSPPGTVLGEFQGLRLRSDPEGIAIVSIVRSSPAAATSLARGAILTNVNGEELSGQSVYEILDRIRHDAASSITARLTSGQIVQAQVFWQDQNTVVKTAVLPLGTDEIGRDVLARLAQGARVSLFVGIIVQAIALTVGIVVGTLGTFGPRWISVPLLRFTDGMFAFPDILLAILIIGLFGMGMTSVIVALSITSWPSIARLVKNQMATLKDREFVVAARAAGAPVWYQVIKHILPQLWGILLAVSMIDIAGTILAESTLSFLGIGVQAPDPSWGTMINNARSDMNSHPEALIWPCLILSLTIFALNFVGDGLRAYLDPKSK